MEKKIFNHIIVLFISIISHNLIAQPPTGPDGTGLNAPTANIGEKNINQLFISPEVSQLLKVNFIPMNLYTGKLGLEIPLYEIKTGDISVPISLKYNSEGIKIEEEASNVGTGWVLQAGGSVNKMVRDIEDRTLYSRLYSINSGSYAAKTIAFGSLTSPGNATPDASGDLVPDLFIATAPGMNSKFYYSKDYSTNTSYTVNEIGNQGNKIVHGEPFARVYDGDLKSLAWVGINKVFPYYYNQGFLNEIQNTVDNLFQNYPSIFFDYADFNITNPKGINYKFKTSDINVAFPTGVSGDVLYFGVPDPQKFFWAVRGFMMEKYNINKGTWHLDEITDSSNKKVNFKYISFTNSKITKYPNTMTDGSVSLPNEGGTQNESNGVPTYSYSGERNNDHSFYSMNPLYHYVQKIKWESGEIDFFYEKDREDVVDKKALSKVLVKDKNLQIIKEYLFTYSYLSAGTAKRLKLERIDVMEGHQQNKLYEFSYYENNNLPSQNSYKKDFLGYYNNSNLSDDLPMTSYIPKLYFVRNRKNLSITPFNVNSAVEISGGNRNIEANNYSSTGLLKSIKNRTGTYNEFTYESNSFRFYDQDVLGGGSRIALQVIKEAGNPVRKIKYRYIDNEGNSSGTIANLPKFASLGAVKTANNMDTYRFGINLRSTRNIELTDGSYVGYERVIEEEEGKGRTEYQYTSPKQYPNTYSTAYVPVGGYNNNLPLTKVINSSFFPGDVFMENDKTGKLINKKIFDNNSTLLSSESFQYIDKIFGSQDFRSVKQITRGINPGTMTHTYTVNLKLTNSKNLLSNDESIEFFSGNQVKSKNEYTYGNTSNPFLTFQQHTDPENNIEGTFYRYPSDKNNQFLIEKNILNISLEVETNRNSKMLSKIETKYPTSQSAADSNTSGLPLPISTISTDFQGNSIIESTYDKYDNKGNLLQYTAKGNIPTTVIWGYSQTLPIAKIVGATYAQIMQAFNLDPNSNVSYLLLDIVKKSDLDNDKANEKLLIAELNNFRNKTELKEFQVLTLTHDLLIGVTTNIAASGIKESYQYDKGNRLEKVFDTDNKIIKEYKYNYIPSTFYNIEISKDFIKNNCGADYAGGKYTYTVPSNTYSSKISQADADQQAQNDINNNGQNTANANATCIRFYNALRSQVFTRNNCGFFGIGQDYSYTVPANTYLSVISQADADQQAQDDINANGQRVANTHGTCLDKPFDCTISTDMNFYDHSSSFFNKIYNVNNVNYAGTICFNTKNHNWTALGQGSQKVGKISGMCRPQTFKYYRSSNWSVTIYNNGDIYAQWESAFSNPQPNSNVMISFQFPYE